MKDFGQQGYFLNFPSKFVSENGRKAWLSYSGNYWSNHNGEVLKADPPGSHYGLVLQEIELLSKEIVISCLLLEPIMVASSFVRQIVFYTQHTQNKTNKQQTH